MCDTKQVDYFNNFETQVAREREVDAYKRIP